MPIPSPSLHARAKEIFAAACELPAEQRRGFVAARAAGNTELEQRVARLLAALDGPEEFLREPTALSAPRSHDDTPTADSVSERRDAPARSAPDDEELGALIGPYKLLQLIGEGGFGRVYMAEQEKPVSRRVALKVIKLGMDTRQVVARFEQERQALAMMDHPNIARVLDAGATKTGRPFFVMELVKGDPIVEYCDKSRLSIEDRMELFVQVCHAVQHAHTKGIIHRDLKPSNILVSTQDGRPHSRVIDFGIAKATASKLTEKTLFTEHKQLIGTPEYMSPEQAEGSLDIDTRTDVYSLGVLLYELLTGTTPFSGKELRSVAYAEIQRIIREVEPPRPSTRLTANTDTLASVAARRGTVPNRLGPIVRGELDWIVMKALEKDRQRRYETVNALATDIRRYLADEPVAAGPPSTRYRLRKFVKRNRGRVLAGGVVAAALVLGVIGTTAGLLWALDERTKATHAAAAEATARVAAQENEQRAIDEARRAETAKTLEAKARERAETITAFVTTALKAGDAQNTGGGQDTTILAAMENAVADIDSGRFKDDPQVEAQLRDTIAIILMNNGRYEQSAALFESALALRQHLSTGDDPAVAESINNLGTLYLTQGRLTEAEPLLVRSLEMREKALGPEHVDVGVSLSNVASVYLQSGRFDQAEQLSVRAAAIIEKNRGPAHPETALGLKVLADIYRAQGRYRDAEPLLVRGLAICEKALGPEHPSVASALNALAAVDRDLGKLGEAEPLFMRALAIREKTLGAEHAQVATILNNLGDLYSRQKQFARAEPMYMRALAIREKSLPADHPLTLNTKGNLAALYWLEKKLDKSIPMFEKVVAALETKLGRRHPDTLRNVANLGVNYKDAGRCAEAIPLLEEVRRASKQIPTLRWVSAPLLDAHAAEAARTGDTPRFLAAAKELVADARPAPPIDTPEFAALLVQAGEKLVELEEWSDADVYVREGLAIRERTQPDSWKTFYTRSLLGGVLLGEQKYTEAEPMLIDAYHGMKERAATIPRPSTSCIPEALERLVRLYQKTRNQTEAAAWQHRLASERAERGDSQRAP